MTSTARAPASARSARPAVGRDDAGELCAGAVWRVQQAREQRQVVGRLGGEVAKEAAAPLRPAQTGETPRHPGSSGRRDAARTRATRRCRSCRRRRAAPRTDPDPRRRSTVTTCPSAVTSSTARRLSMASPCVPISHPSPPPSVSPPMPVVDTTPPVVARPWTCVSRLNSPHVTPPCARARRARVDT